MSSDDLTHKSKSGDQEDSTTQPTITAVFRLLREVHEGQSNLNSRFEASEASVNSRFEALELRLARDFASVDARFAEMSDEMKKGLQQLSDRLCDRIDLIRLHADADYEDLTRRLRKLESKVS